MICFNDPTEQGTNVIQWSNLGKNLPQMKPAFKEKLTCMTPCHFKPMKKLLPSGEWGYGLFCAICGEKKTE